MALLEDGAWRGKVWTGAWTDGSGGTYTLNCPGASTENTTEKRWCAGQSKASRTRGDRATPLPFSRLFDPRPVALTVPLRIGGSASR